MCAELQSDNLNVLWHDAMVVVQKTTDGTSYSITACGEVIKTKEGKKTTLGMYSGSFNVYSTQGIQLDYSGDHDDKCQGELVCNTCETFYYGY